MHSVIVAKVTHRYYHRHNNHHRLHHHHHHHHQLPFSFNFNFRSRKRAGPNPFCSCCRSHSRAQTSRPTQENWKLWTTTEKWKYWWTTEKWKYWGCPKKRKPYLPTQTESRKPTNSDWKHFPPDNDLLGRCLLKYPEKWKPGTCQSPSKWNPTNQQPWVSQDSIQNWPVERKPNSVQGSTSTQRVEWKQDFTAWTETEADYWCWYNCQRKGGKRNVRNNSFFTHQSPFYI